MKHKKRSLSISLEPQAGPTHFHLCHFCNHLNESPYLILRCEKCRSPMTLMAVNEEIDGEHSYWETDEELEEDQDGFEEYEEDSDNGHQRVLSEEDYPLLTGLSTLF